MRGITATACATVAVATAAALFASRSPAADIVDVSARAGLPRASVVDGRAVAWRNVSVLAESDLFDVEARVASCLPSVSADFTGKASGCATATPLDTRGGLGHMFALTYKVPRWHAGAPLVDATLRTWRAPLPNNATGARDRGTGGTLLITQPLGPLDAIAGYALPLERVRAAGSWRTTFAGVAWRARSGISVELLTDRDEEVASGTIERTLTLRIARAAAASDLRFSAWAARALDNPSDRWRAGVGLELPL